MSQIYAVELRAMKHYQNEREIKNRTNVKFEITRKHIISTACTGNTFLKVECAIDIIFYVEEMLKTRFPDSKISAEVFNQHSFITIDWS
jgi:hypothetical protein